MKSPKSTPSTTEERAMARSQELRHVLDGRRREIEASVRGQLSTVREERATADHANALDDGEVSDVDIQEEVELALVQMRLETLQRLDVALARLDAGLYGRCTGCGEDIAAARLRALPFAVRCRDCEGVRESAADSQRRLDRGHAVAYDMAVRFR